MMGFLTRHTILLLSIFWISFTFAQSPCSNSLYQANNLYKSGQLEEAIDLLEPCLAEIRNADMKFEAYKLMALLNWDLDRIADADDYIEEMLELRPHYLKFPNNDPKAFDRHVHEFKVDPGIRLGITAGLNQSYNRIANSYLTSESQSNYPSNSGYYLGVLAFQQLTENYAMTVAFGLTNTFIAHEVKDLNTEQWRFYRERLQLLNLGVGIHRRLPRLWNQEFTIDGQVGTQFMVTSRVNMNTESISGRQVFQDSKNGLMDRNRFQPYLAAGVNWHRTLVNDHRVSVSLGYQFFLRNTVNSDARYDDQRFIFQNEYLNDDVKLRLFLVNVSYAIPLNYKVIR